MELMLVDTVEAVVLVATSVNMLLKILVVEILLLKKYIYLLAQT